MKSCGNGGITDFSENDEQHSDGIENEVFLDNGEKSCCSGISDFFDDEKVSNIILEDFRSCKLGKITLERVKN